MQDRNTGSTCLRFEQVSVRQRESSSSSSSSSSSAWNLVELSQLKNMNKLISHFLKNNLGNEKTAGKTHKKS